MRVLRRVVVVFVIVDVIALVVARVLKKTLPNHGETDSNEFAKAAVMDGVEFASAAGEFRQGSAVAVMGGVDLDLSRCTPAPRATLQITAVMGGVRVIVPDTWLITTDVRAIAGGVERDITQSDLGDDAPHLHITGLAVMGGVMVATADSPYAAKPSLN